MVFNARAHLDPVTFGWLLGRAMDVGLHCFPCGRHVVVPVRSLPFGHETPVPAKAGRFKCTRCGSRQTEARPEWPNEGGRVKEAFVAG
jgi:hypothetical protein